MATLEEHERKARHNEAFLKTVSTDFPDWQAVAAFYVAIQWIEAMLAVRGEHCSDHSERKQAVKRSFPSIAKSYDRLYNTSLIARYDDIADRLNAEKVKSELLNKALPHIQEFAKSWIKRNSPGE